MVKRNDPASNIPGYLPEPMKKSHKKCAIRQPKLMHPHALVKILRGFQICFITAKSKMYQEATIDD